MNAKEVLAMFQDMSEGESDGEEINDPSFERERSIS